MMGEEGGGEGIEGSIRLIRAICDFTNYSNNVMFLNANLFSFNHYNFFLIIIIIIITIITVIIIAITIIIVIIIIITIIIVKKKMKISLTIRTKDEENTQLVYVQQDDIRIRLIRA